MNPFSVKDFHPWLSLSGCQVNMAEAGAEAAAWVAASAGAASAADPPNTASAVTAVAAAAASLTDWRDRAAKGRFMAFLRDVAVADLAGRHRHAKKRYGQN